MRLYLNETSPFSRLVLVSALETKVSQMDLIWIDPWASPHELLQLNPFSTVPTLQPKEGSALYESLMICQYLIESYGSSKMSMPTHHLPDLQTLALAKSLMELSFRKVVMQRWGASDNPLFERCDAALKRVLNSIVIENNLTEPTQGPGLFSSLCLAVALDYVRFRMPDMFDVHLGIQTSDWLGVWCAREALHLTSPEKLQAQPATLSRLRCT
jgi:glutathione S-transferase